MPANAERLGSRIERSLASFAGRAGNAEACYVFVLIDGATQGVVGISAIEAAVGLAEPWYNYHVGTQVHASRELGVYTRAPTLFLTNDHTGNSELCSLFLDARYRHGRNGPLLAKARLLFIAEFADRFAAEDHRRDARAGSTPAARARSGKAWAAISSPSSIRAPTI